MKTHITHEEIAEATARGGVVDDVLVDKDAALLAQKLSTMNRKQRRALIKKLTRKPKPKRKRKPRR